MAILANLLWLGASVTVEFQDIWGKVTMDIGADDRSSEDEEIVCEAHDASPGGKFVWMLDDSVLDNPNEIQEISPGEYEQTLSFKPKLSMHDKELICRYEKDDGFGNVEEEFQAKITLKMQIQILPQSPVTVGPFNPDGPIKLPVDFQLFPPPKDENIVWSVEDGEDISNILPGQTDKLEAYEASKIMNLGGNKYRSELTIKSPSEDETSKSHFLTIKSAENKRIDIAFSMSREAAPTTEYVIEVTTEAPTSTMGPGLYVIIALVLLILVICICYCIWQKFFRKKDEAEPRNKTADNEQQGDYRSVPQNDKQQV